MRNVIVGLAAAAALVGCGGSAAWAEAPSASTARIEHQARARLRAEVAAGAAGQSAGDERFARTESIAGEEAELAPAADGGGGIQLSLDFGGGPPAPSPWDAPAGAGGGGEGAAEIRRQLEADVQRGAAATEARPRYAQNDATPEEAEPRTATDATSRQLLIYEAHLGLAVHHVVEVQDRVEAMARERGGFLHSRTDDTVVVRVPADAFQELLDALEELGDVVTRRVQVQDVTEEFRDVQQRIRTLSAMRARVEQLLREAEDVEDALAVQQHLERITVELEQLQGRLRFLSDRVAYSTLTVHFAERSAASAPTFQLPFRWLHSLGLDTLLSL